jgi:hypothetical protein
MSGDLVKVRVVPGWAVFDGIAQRTGGDVVDVPADVAADWIAAGWVKKVTARRKSESRSE